MPDAETAKDLTASRSGRVRNPWQSQVASGSNSGSATSAGAVTTLKTLPGGIAILVARS